MKIYVASSWRNGFQPGVVAALREKGHEVYDFKDSDGFHWTEVDPAWQSWPSDIPKYLKGLNHPCAERGYKRDMSALVGCDICVYVMPCGVSASLECGWACGAGKLVVVYVPGLREPDLMVKMAHLITDSLESVLAYVGGVQKAHDEYQQRRPNWVCAECGTANGPARYSCMKFDCSGIRPKEGQHAAN